MRSKRRMHLQFDLRSFGISEEAESLVNMARDKEKWFAEEDKKDDTSAGKLEKAGNLDPLFPARLERNPGDPNLVFELQEDGIRKPSSEIHRLRQRVNELESS